MRHSFRSAMLVLCAWAAPAWCDLSMTPAQAELQALYTSFAAANAGLPLQVHSGEHQGVLQAEVLGVLEHPFDAVRQVLASPERWCDFVPVVTNVSACTPGPAEPRSFLHLNVESAPGALADRAFELSYDYQVQQLQPDYVALLLRAGSGPFGTRDYRISVQATPVDGAHTFVRLQYAYRTSLMSRMVMGAYLATAGRHKVGFTVVDHTADGAPVYVKGRQGLIERNVVRYYLALQAFLDVSLSPGQHAREACGSHWYDLTQQYRRQLFENMDKQQYLETKRRQLASQIG